uniref:RxLR effector candidate protein n=1 Tax=Hyaloperonospora arabidopsidis (strain Emoy2) TaxID=559515 RepID=M4BC78_HYAAE
MPRSCWTFVLLVVTINLFGSLAFHWPFTNPDDEAAATPTSNALPGTTPAVVHPSPALAPATAPLTISPTTPPQNNLDALVASAGKLELDAEGRGSFIDTSSLKLNFTVAKATTALSDIVPTYRNWVGPRASSPEAACYREAHIMDTCPTNFDRNEVTNTCWAECPLGYPVECGIECIRQGDDCTMEALNKVGAVMNSALAIGSIGSMFRFWPLAKQVTRAFDCANMMIGSMRAIIRYLRGVQTAYPTASMDRILAVMYQSNNIVTDLPMAVYLCMGWKFSRPLDIAGRVLTSMNWILMNAIIYKDDIFSSWSKFKAFLIGANFTEAVNRINETEIGTLSDALKSKSNCGYNLRALTDRTWNTVHQLRADYPGISEDDLRLKMQNTQLVTSDIAIATNNCMDQLILESDEATAYVTREKIRTAFSAMINQLVSKGTSNNGTTEDSREFMYLALSKTLISIAVTGTDLIGVTGLFVTYLQHVCGPTNFMGEIDDGTDPKTLGLTVIGKAFNKTTMSWTRRGEGAVIVNFKSTDTKNVTVNIMSGGDKIDEVEVHAGGAARWKSNITVLAGKTLYFDRWRPGFLGLPGTGGGSLLLWVPHSSEGGHLEVQVMLNVT